MYCKHCGKEIADDSVFCKHCGGRTDDKPIKADTTPQPKTAPPKVNTPPKDNKKVHSNCTSTPKTEYNPKEKIPMGQVLGSYPKQQNNFSIRKWVPGFRSSGVVLGILSFLWYFIAFINLFAVNKPITLRLQSCLFMLALIYFLSGIIHYKKYENSLYIILIGAIFFLGGGIANYNTPESYDNPTPTATLVQTTQAPEATKTPEDLEKSKEELKESVDKLNESVGISTETKPEDQPFNPSEYVSAPEYEELARYPGNYENGKYKFYGKAIQVSEGIFNTTIRLKLHDDTDQIIYCQAPNDMFEKRRLLEGDYATFYGVYKGVTTYTSVLGANITVPKIIVTQWIP